MKVLGISGSPRKDGNTEILLRETLRAVEQMDCTTVSVRPTRLDAVPPERETWSLQRRNQDGRDNRVGIPGNT